MVSGTPGGALRIADSSAIEPRLPPAHSSPPPTVEVTIEYGRTVLSRSEFESIEVGDRVVLEQLPGEPVDIRIGPRLVARGELIVVDGRLGVRISEIGGEAM